MYQDTFVAPKPKDYELDRYVSEVLKYIIQKSQHDHLSKLFGGKYTDLKTEYMEKYLYLIYIVSLEEVIYMKY